VKESENMRLVQFSRGQIIDSCLVGAPVTETSTLLGVSRATVGTHESVRENQIDCHLRLKKTVSKITQ
jgi:hypothetical protein